MHQRPLANAGFTLIEIIVAAVLGFFIAAGTMMAFTTSVKIAENSSSESEGAFLAEQTLERLRNSIACRQVAAGENQTDAWYDQNCAADAPAAAADNLPVVAPPPGSILGFGPVGRNYTTTAVDCDGDGATGDCYQVQVTVNWNPPQ